MDSRCLDDTLAIWPTMARLVCESMQLMMVATVLAASCHRHSDVAIRMACDGVQMWVSLAMRLDLRAYSASSQRSHVARRNIANGISNAYATDLGCPFLRCLWGSEPLRRHIHEIQLCDSPWQSVVDRRPGNQRLWAKWMETNKAVSAMSSFYDQKYFYCQNWIWNNNNKTQLGDYLCSWTRTRTRHKQNHTH